MDPKVLLENFEIIQQILRYISYTMGIFFIAIGVFKFKRYGEMRTQMSAQITILSPMMPMIVGILLVRWPDLLALTVGSLYGSSNPLDYHGSVSGYKQYIQPVILLVRIVGAGAIIRGMVLLSRAGGPQSQQGMVGKALIHIFGGALAYNIIKTVNFIRQIFDL